MVAVAEHVGKRGFSQKVKLTINAVSAHIALKITKTFAMAF